MTIPTAIREGLRRVSASPKLIVLLWIVNFAMALPLAWILAGEIQSAIGASLVHEKLRAGFDIDWYGEFDHAASGVTKTFSPAVIGIGPFLENLEAWLNGNLSGGAAAIFSVGIAFAVIWMFLLGGILDRFARQESGFSMESFFSAASRYFPRLLVLAIMAGVLYSLVYAFISPGLFSFVRNATRDVTAERPIFFLTAGAYLIVAFLLVLVNMAFDYAKISTVLKNQRNVLVAARHGFRFIWSHPGKTFGLYLSLGVITLLFLGIYSLIAPGAGQASVFTVMLAFLVGQLYLIIKLITRLTFFGSQMALYESMTGGNVAEASTVSEESK
jgi:hypothetical protein